MKRRISVVTSARADWGLLFPVVKLLKTHPGAETSVIATNMHLSPRYGMTVEEIEADGITVDERVPMPETGSDSPVGKAVAAAACLEGMAQAFERLRPDIVLLLGDRYEMLAVASAATIMGIPIAHIAGGEITLGAIDDNIRHALTKLSSLHFTATEVYRQRVIQMGEPPSRVWNTGALGVYNFANEQLLSREELEASIGIELNRRTLLVTLHPATRDNIPVAERCRALLEAIDGFRASKIIFTYPNNDADGKVIIDMIQQYAAANPDRTVLIPSLGRQRYLSALRYVGAVVGNSSSGLVEVPSAGIPTVDIGIRQKGRLAPASVIHCDADTESIAAAISFALSPEGQRRAKEAQNPYYRPDTPDIIVRARTETPLSELSPKQFYDFERIPLLRSFPTDAPGIKWNS